jgi:hypothetical protein
MSDNQQIFDAWLAGKLTEAECRSALAQDAQWLSRVEMAATLQHMASRPQFEHVPEIDTSRLFQQQWGRKKATFAWWPQLSVGMSALALLISISPLQMQSHQGGLTLSWGGNNEQQIQQQVTSLLASYKTEQQQYLQQTLQLQQQQQSAQLVLLKDYLTENEQKARRTDMLELVEYLNQQRQADWQYWQDHAQPQQASLNYSPDNRSKRTN